MFEARREIPAITQEVAVRTILPTILVVDDDPLIAAGLERALRRHARVLSTTDARIARRIVSESENIAFVVLDLTMPEYDAIEFLKEIDEQDLFPPVVLISGQHRNILHIAARYAEAVGVKVLDVLEKPFISNGLAQTLSKLAA